MKIRKALLAAALAAGMVLTGIGGAGTAGGAGAAPVAGTLSAYAAVRNGLNFWSSGHYHTAYMFPESSQQFLTEQDLAGYTKSELRIGRNEIYARHGRMFRDIKLQEHFLEKVWYQPTVMPDAFQESVLSSLEKANISRLYSAETRASAGNPGRIAEIVNQFGPRPEYDLQLSTGAPEEKKVIEHADCFEVTGCTLVINDDPVPAEKVQNVKTGDVIEIDGLRYQVTNPAAGYAGDVVEVSCLENLRPDGLADNRTYELIWEAAEWLSPSGSVWWPTMANDYRLRRTPVYTGSVYFAKDCKVRGTGIGGGGRKEMPVRDYLLVPHSLDTLDFEYGKTAGRFSLYGDIAVDGRGYITEYTETYTP